MFSQPRHFIFNFKTLVVKGKAGGGNLRNITQASAYSFFAKADSIQIKRAFSPAQN